MASRSPTPPRLLALGALTDGFRPRVAELERLGVGVDFLLAPSRERMIAAIRDTPTPYHALLLMPPSFLARPFNADILAPLTPHLKCVVSFGAGYDHVDVDWLSSNRICFANGPRSVADPTATTTVMLILQTLSGAYRAEQNLRSGNWMQGLFTMYAPDVRDVTVGIIGLGSIGKLVARKIAALGMTVVYNSRRRLSEQEEAGVRYVSLDELLRTSDLISLHAPYSTETHHLLDDAAFAKMKPNVCIVNTSRGALIDEEALVQAMQSGNVLRVGLDVYEKEPTVHPWLLTTDRASLLPHFAWHTNRIQQDGEKEAVENLAAWVNTGVPVSAVNRGVLGL